MFEHQGLGFIHLQGTGVFMVAARQQDGPAARAGAI
jgi:hypothetical protein